MPESPAPESPATENPLQAALAEATDTRVIVAGPDVLDRTGSAFTETFGPGALAQLVADENTWAAAGDQVRASLAQADVELAEPFVLPGTPTLYADYQNVERIREHLRPRAGVEEVLRSATLNDLVKLACAELDREYLGVGTAAWRDGYAGYGASITPDGLQITRQCTDP